MRSGAIFFLLACGKTIAAHDSGADDSGAADVGVTSNCTTHLATRVCSKLEVIPPQLLSPLVWIPRPALAPRGEDFVLVDANEMFSLRLVGSKIERGPAEPIVSTVPCSYAGAGGHLGALCDTALLHYDTSAWETTLSGHGQYFVGMNDGWGVYLNKAGNEHAVGLYGLTTNAPSVEIPVAAGTQLFGTTCGPALIEGKRAKIGRPATGIAVLEDVGDYQVIGEWPYAPNGLVARHFTDNWLSVDLATTAGVQHVASLPSVANASYVIATTFGLLVFVVTAEGWRAAVLAPDGTVAAEATNVPGIGQVSTVHASNGAVVMWIWGDQAQLTAAAIRCESP